MGNSKHNKRQISSSQSLLKQEIVQLQKELKGQTMVRSALEKALSCHPLLDDPAFKSLSQPAENLIKEIAVLELEVVYLEKYLLSMYRKSFANLEDSAGSIVGPDPLLDSGIFRSHSSLSQHSACSFRASPSVAEALDAYHSLPLSMLERTQESTSSANLAEYLGSSFRDCVGEKPNLLSEEMIKCISTVYCHLSHPPFIPHSTFGNIPESSPPQEHHGEQHSSFSSWLKEFSGSFFTMVEVRSIVRDSQRLNSVQDLLQKYKSLISRLAQVDPGKLNHDEKLAFWINVHNALVMHAFMVYGVPRGSLKRMSLVLKAAYNIGGHTVSVDTIQTSILRCRLPRPALWLQSLFLPKTKFKSGDPRKAFTIKYSEPRLRFALCSGCQSDPAVRLYTPKKVFQELEMAKEEYIQMNIKLHKEQRLAIPKNVEYFTKEMGLSPSGLVEMLEHSMPESCGNFFQHPQHGKLLKKVDFVPHNFTFRFLLAHELVRWREQA